MKWNYKVVTTDKLLRRTNDYDIAVSKEEVDARRNKSQLSLENELGKLGSDGWEFVTLIGDFGIFKKQAS